MTRIKKKYQGQHTNRFSREPLEKKFALSWERHNSTSGAGPDAVDHLSTTAGELHASDRERAAINTTIQWLGSTIGLAWLMETLGFKDVHSERDLAELKAAWSRHRVKRSRG